MKTLREYIEIAEERMQSPDTGDVFAFELDDGTLLETYVMDRNEIGDVLLDSTEEMFSLLESWNLLSEDNNDSNPVVNAITKRIMTSRLDLVQKYGPEYVMQAIDDVADFAGDWDEIGTSDVSGWVRQVEWNLKNKLNQYDEPMDVGDALDEAEYQGRKVPLNKPMRGDVKKFKVYVRNPKTGNIKKVNFGHGGTSARRAGQKTMRIRKSDPDRRRSFRARHNCDNPGPKTGARYWSCRKW